MPSCRPTTASVKALPVVEKAGMIWVWPGKGVPGALPEPAYQAPKNFALQAEIVMDLDVEHGLMMENLLDLAHAPFTHTGTFAKGWLVPNLVRFVNLPQAPRTGYWDPYPIHMCFEPPCYVISTIGLRGKDCGRHLHQLHACVPKGKGKTRLLYRLYLDFYKWIRFIPGNFYFWQHLAQQVVGEDIRLVRGQQERLQAGENVWNQPVGYDKLGVLYRRWRNQVEYDSPEWNLIGSMEPLRSMPEPTLKPIPEPWDSPVPPSPVPSSVELPSPSLTTHGGVERG
jgi:chlorophyllide a oxygenase